MFELFIAERRTRWRSPTIGTIWRALMLEHLGPKAADARSTRKWCRMRYCGDLGGTAKIVDVSSRVIQNVREL
jgi:hypothetical protein